MECSRCGHHFCWLCMGDQKDHNTSDGHFMCKNVIAAEELLKKNGKDTNAKTKKVNQQEAMRNIMRLAHYMTLYKEHQRSVHILTQQKQKIISEVTIHSKNDKTIKLKDLESVMEIMQFAINARRTLSYTYAIRYNLKGIKKQVFFDLIQSEMEKSMDKFQRSLDHHIMQLGLALRFTNDIAKNLVQMNWKLADMRSIFSHQFS